jgi:hypothetical protein
MADEVTELQLFVAIVKAAISPPAPRHPVVLGGFADIGCVVFSVNSLQPLGKIRARSKREGLPRQSRMKIDAKPLILGADTSC